jgi:nickel/cobalt transporter (NiCoT) family protein
LAGHKSLTMLSIVALANAGFWLVVIVALRSHPLMLGTAFLAYTLGLRHGVDADHIAAIDNVTRKLMHDRKVPIAAGLFFSLGHSSVVVALCIAMAAAASFLAVKLPLMRSYGSIAGTVVSALFLLAIAVINTLVLCSLIRLLSAQRKKISYNRPLDQLLSQRGFLGRLIQPLFCLVSHSWQMYPIGLLFGLGFDTATEVAVLGIAALEGARGLPVITILIFPLLFTAGMTLVDTADSVLMYKAYGWAFAQPERKLRYNITITLISVLMAAFIGSLQVLNFIGSQVGTRSWFLNQAASLNASYGTIGLVIVLLLMFIWALWAIVYRGRARAEDICHSGGLRSNGIR